MKGIFCTFDFAVGESAAMSSPITFPASFLRKLLSSAFVGWLTEGSAGPAGAPGGAWPGGAVGGAPWGGVPGGGAWPGGGCWVYPCPCPYEGGYPGPWGGAP